MTFTGLHVPIKPVGVGLGVLERVGVREGVFVMPVGVLVRVDVRVGVLVAPVDVEVEVLVRVGVLDRVGVLVRDGV